VSRYDDGDAIALDYGCPCGDDCTMVAVDCHDGLIPECCAVWVLDSNGDRDVRVCRDDTPACSEEWDNGTR
jgi:hypothetical protein